jgi:hypothetical protein
MGDISSRKGVCQDINAYAVMTGIAGAPRANASSILPALNGSKFPLPFQGIDRWDQKRVVSPYASGFTAEALFERPRRCPAVELVEGI